MAKKKTKRKRFTVNDCYDEIGELIKWLESVEKRLALLEDFATNVNARIVRGDLKLEKEKSHGIAARSN